jgi:hypothetical protein
MTVVLTTGTISWKPVAGQEGNVTVELRASDGKGFTAQRFVIKVAPGNLIQVITVTIQHPGTGQKVSGNLTVSGTASVVFGKLYEVQVKIDSSSWVSAVGLGSWNYTFDTRTLTNGDHTVSVRAWDGSTYSDPKTVHITVSNGSTKPPTPDNTIFGFSLGICILGVVIFIAILIGAVYAFTRSSAPPRQRPPQSPYARDGQQQRERPPDRYDRDYYREKGPGEDYGRDYEGGYDQGHDQNYDQGHDPTYDQNNDPNYQQGYDDQYQDYPQDQGYQDQGPSGQYQRR